MRNHVRPGRACVCMVAMKFRPVRIDEKPEIKMPMIVGMTLVRGECVLKGV